MIQIDFCIPRKYRGKPIKFQKTSEYRSPPILFVPKRTCYLHVNPLEDIDSKNEYPPLSMSQEIWYLDQEANLLKTQILDNQTTTWELMKNLENLLHPKIIN